MRGSDSQSRPSMRTVGGELTWWTGSSSSGVLGTLTECGWLNGEAGSSVKSHILS